MLKLIVNLACVVHTKRKISRILYKSLIVEISKCLSEKKKKIVSEKLENEKASSYQTIVIRVNENEFHPDLATTMRKNRLPELVAVLYYLSR